MSDALAPLIIALTGLPALGIALWSGGDGGPHARGLQLRWALVALSLFVGAIGLYLAAGNRTATWAVAIAMVVAVHAVGVSLVLHLRRAAAGERRQ
ncbi:hypothetical protein MASR1M8_09050 [Thermomonas brevis]